MGTIYLMARNLQKMIWHDSGEEPKNGIKIIYITKKDKNNIKNILYESLQKK